MLHARRLAWILLASIVAGFPSAGESAPAKAPAKAIRISFFELVPQNVEKQDLAFKRYLEGKLAKNLKQAGLLVDTLTSAQQGFIRDEADFARLSQSDFILKGTFTYVDNQFAVSVLLSRRDGKGVLREVLPARESRVPKELASYVLIPWFDYLSAVIANLARDRPYRQAVLTHCFDGYPHEAEIKDLAEYLAVELRGELESGRRLGAQYQVLGFQERDAVIQVCAPGRRNVGAYLDLYDFVISGDVRSGRPGEVTIGVKIRAGGQSKLRGNLTSAKDYALLVGKVGQYIVARWPAVTGK